MSSEGLAIEAYFDTEISTRLEPKKETGTLLVKMLDEEVPPVFPEIVYERVLYTEIIFDASKTMEEPDINGIRKLDIAKKIVSVLVNYFPQRDTRFALRVNGARYSNNCLDSELVVPFSRQNGKQVLEAIKTIQPRGLSPLTYSIRQLFQDFAGTQGTKIVFVVTDGLETCDVEPVDACTVTMDMFQQADFKGSLNIIGINTIYDDAKILLSCLAARGNGEFLDSNRNNSSEFGKLIQNSSQLSYSISKIIDPETLSEGKILELINRRIGDFTTIEGTNVVLQPQRHVGYSSHDLEPGVYKIELVTIPALTSYFTIDRGQVLTIGVVRSGLGLDLYDRAHLALGNRYYDHGQIEEALAEYQKVIKFDDRNVDAHLNLGIIYEDILKDKEKATEHYKAYLELQGPRQEEVRDWLRKIRGEPTTAEELEQKRREREEKKTAEEAKRLEAEKQKQLGQARDKALEVYKDIVTANPGIVVPEEDVISGTVVHVTVPDTTTDLQAQRIAQNIARRIRESLQREPEILIFRQSDPNTPINIPEESSTTPEMVF
jgi:tetratricopeptide (TPR) repeat protein